MFVVHDIEDEPGKQARSVVRIKNFSKSHVAFKVVLSRLGHLLIGVVLFKSFLCLIQLRDRKTSLLYNFVSNLKC